MNNKFPGSSYDNPIWYGKWRIYLHKKSYKSPFTYTYCHDDYDETSDTKDNRYGYSFTIEGCKSDIDEFEAENE